jgi:hypothetical protein
MLPLVGVTKAHIQKKTGNNCDKTALKCGRYQLS